MTSPNNVWWSEVLAFVRGLIAGTTTINVAGGGDVNIRDGAGTPLTSTPVGVDQALDVNIIAGAGAGGTSSVDGAAFAPGATALTIAGGEVDDVAPVAIGEGNSGALRMSTRRELHVQIRDAAGNERGLNVDAAGRIAITDGGIALTVDDGGGSLTVDDGGVPLSVDDNGGSLTIDGTVTADVRDGAGVALTSTLVGADQALDVNIVQTIGGAGGTSMVDDAVFTPGTTQVTPIAAFADEVAPDSVDEGDAGAVRMSLNRNLNVRIRDDAGNERGLNIDAAGAIAVTDGGGALTVDNPALSVVGGGAEAAAQRVTIANDSTGLLSVDDNGGSLTVDGGVTADIRDGAGVALTSTLVGADQALDVNLVQAVAITIQEPLSVDDNGGSLTVDNATISVVGGGAEATAQRVTIANDSTGVLSVDDNAGSLTVDNPALSVVGGGAEATAQRVTIANDSTGVLTVDDGGGALTVDGTVTAANAAGDIADDAPDSGNPVKIGGVAVETDGTDPTSVSAEGDRAEVRTDRNRRLLVNTVHPNLWSNNTNWGAAQTDTQIQAAPGANLSLYITDVVMSAEGACNILLVRNTAASATIWGPFYFAANGGLVKHFATPIRLPANENLGVTSSAAVNHTVSVQGYIAP